MEEVSLRPRLATFRVIAFNSENRNEGNGAKWVLELKQEIQFGLAVPTVPGGVIQTIVMIELKAQAHNESVPEQTAAFKGEYQAKFSYASEVTEAAIAPLMDQDAYQYGLIAQAFPLAMMHFRRELLATGFDGRDLPIGL